MTEYVATHHWHRPLKKIQIWLCKRLPKLKCTVFSEVLLCFITCLFHFSFTFEIGKKIFIGWEDKAISFKRLFLRWWTRISWSFTLSFYFYGWGSKAPHPHLGLGSNLHSWGLSRRKWVPGEFQRTPTAQGWLFKCAVPAFDSLSEQCS